MLHILLSELVERYGLKYEGENVIIEGFNLANRQIESDNILTYAESEKYLYYGIGNVKVKAILTTEKLADSFKEKRNDISYVFTEFPEHTFYTMYNDLVSLGAFDNQFFKTDESSVIDKGIGVVIEAGVRFGKNVRIGHNTIIKSGTIIGDNVSIGCGSIIGSEGFQLIKDRFGNNLNVPHIGGVYIGNNVSIGDCTTVCKSLFEGFTKIDDYTKIDNHVHIAHNCNVGKNCSITAHCTMFGSSSIGNNVWMAPHSKIMNGATVGDGTFIGTSAFVEGKVPSNNRLFGIPAKPIDEYMREQVYIKRCIHSISNRK